MKNGSWFLLLVVLFVAHPARADRRELYVTAAIAPTMSQYENPLIAQGKASQAGIAAELSIYWGLTNTWHIGAAVRASRARNIRFSDVQMTTTEGWQSGAVFADDFGVGVSGLLLYRVDTHQRIAPVLMGEIGFARHEYSHLEFDPNSKSYGYGFGSKAETRLNARIGATLEYRFATRYVISGGVTYSIEPGGLAPRVFSFPLRMGYIWP